MTVMFPPKPAPHLGARDRHGRVLTAVPTSLVSHDVPAADALFGTVQLSPGKTARPPGDGYEYNDS